MIGDDDRDTFTAGDVEVATPVLAVTGEAAAAAAETAAATCSPRAAATTAICSMSPEALDGSVNNGSTREFSMDEGRESSLLTSILGGITATTSLSRLTGCWVGSSPNKGDNFDSEVVESAASRRMHSGMDRRGPLESGSLFT